MFIAGVAQAQRIENVFAHIGFIALPGQKLDDVAEDHVAAVVVFEGAAGRKIERHIFGERDDFARAAVAPRFLREEMRQRRIARYPRCMRQQMKEGDIRPGSRRIGKMLRDLVVKCEAAAFHQLQDRGRGELLGQ